VASGLQFGGEGGEPQAGTEVGAGGLAAGALALDVPYALPF
jgi:hypothetical protein